MIDIFKEKYKKKPLQNKLFRIYYKYSDIKGSHPIMAQSKEEAKLMFTRKYGSGFDSIKVKEV